MSALETAIDNIESVDLIFETNDNNGAIISFIPEEYIDNGNEIIIHSNGNTFIVDVSNTEYNDIEEQYECFSENSVVIIEFNSTII